VGEGSTFTIDLPAVYEPPPESPAAELLADSGPTSAVPAIGVRRVLAIDDDPTVREMLKRRLGREGWKVDTAPGGREGLEIARRLLPDAITLDVMMPVMDGWSVLSALKADPRTYNIPVILLSVVDDRKRGLALGASECLTKPIDMERLIGELRRHVPVGPPLPESASSMKVAAYVDPPLPPVTPPMVSGGFAKPADGKAPAADGKTPADSDLPATAPMVSGSVAKLAAAGEPAAGVAPESSVDEPRP